MSHVSSIPPFLLNWLFFIDPHQAQLNSRDVIHTWRTEGILGACPALCSSFVWLGLRARANFVLQLTQNDRSETIKASALATNMRRSAGTINRNACTLSLEHWAMRVSTPDLLGLGWDTDISLARAPGDPRDPSPLRWTTEKNNIVPYEKTKPSKQ